MSDSWEHDLWIEKVLTADPAVLYPRYIDGAGRSPPENVGGIPGFYRFLDALEDPKHPDHAHLLNWYGGPFEAKAVGEDKIRERLATIAIRRLRKVVPAKRKN